MVKATDSDSVIFKVRILVAQLLQFHIVRCGLSPNGKATDSDSVIFKVQILVAHLQNGQDSLKKQRDSGLLVHYKTNDYKTREKRVSKE